MGKELNIKINMHIYMRRYMRVSLPSSSCAIRSSSVVLL
jgi:hypothetical protein